MRCGLRSNGRSWPMDDEELVLVPAGFDILDMAVVGR
jgi:hypothetical protein